MFTNGITHRILAITENPRTKECLELQEKVAGKIIDVLLYLTKFSLIKIKSV